MELREILKSGEKYVAVMDLSFEELSAFLDLLKHLKHTAQKKKKGLKKPVVAKRKRGRPRKRLDYKGKPIIEKTKS